MAKPFTHLRTIKINYICYTHLHIYIFSYIFNNKAIYRLRQWRICGGKMARPPSPLGPDQSRFLDLDLICGSPYSQGLQGVIGRTLG